MPSGHDNHRRYRPYRGRFAPTPSGDLHQGSLVAALGSYLDARSHGGTWNLRIDDLDAARCKPATTQRIISQLEAHGLIPDGEIIIQHTRHALYEEALNKLTELGLTYRCRCSRKQLRMAVQKGIAKEGLAGPIYPGTCREHAIAANEPAGIRFVVPNEPITVHDRLLGQITQTISTQIGDPILQRSDGVFAYHLAEVVDNQTMGITHVVRGSDLAPLTPLHLALHQALFPNTPAPVYAHLPIVLGENGLKLSKTNHAAPLDCNHARENLITAACFLGLACEQTRGDINDLLADWTKQWTRGHEILKAIEAP